MKKIQLLLMIRNGEDTVIQALQSWASHVDRIYVLDTGSTDDTLNLLRKFKNQVRTRMVIKQSPFKDFSTSRNELLAMSNNSYYDYSVMIDDSYELVGNLLELKTLNDPVIGINISDGICTYPSNRIKKTNVTMVKYQGAIHESLNYPYSCVLKNAHINDIQTERQAYRTLERNKKDLELLSISNTPRSLFYRAMTLYNQYKAEKTTKITVIEAMLERANIQAIDTEETLYVLLLLGEITQDYEYYLQAAKIFPARSGECYFYAYQLTNNDEYLTSAIRNKALGNHRLPVVESIYKYLEQF